MLGEALDNLINEDELRKKLAKDRPLRVKLGIDPTASDIHLGFAVVLRKLRQFQERGHTAVLILGDYTAQIGDPSGRSVTRPRLSKEQVDEHAATYVEQLHQVLLPEPLEIRRNSEWLATMDIEDVLRLASQATVAQMLQRDDFAKRYANGQPISVMEFLYPLLQGWDSVMVEADVELGGSDQLWNFLMARALQTHEGQEPQVVLTMPLLVGLDGVQKMSKSLGNYVGIAEAPTEQFGKLMSLPDELMPQYFDLATGWPLERADEVKRELESGAQKPVEAKRLLARTVVDLYHGDGAGAAAEARVQPGLRRPRGARRRPRRADPARRRARRAHPGRHPRRARVSERGDVEQGRPAQDRAGRREPRRRTRHRRRARRRAGGRRRQAPAAGPAQLGPPPRLTWRHGPTGVACSD